MSHDALRTLHVTHYKLHVARCTLHNTRYTLHVARCTLHVTQYTLHVTVAHYTLHVTFGTLHVGSLHVCCCCCTAAVCKFFNRFTTHRPIRFAVESFELQCPSDLAVAVRRIESCGHSSVTLRGDFALHLALVVKDAFAPRGFFFARGGVFFTAPG